MTSGVRIRLAARLFVFLASVVAAFQVALVFGAPWGRFTWGGRFPDVLPTGMRAVAALSVALLAGSACLIASRAGMLRRGATRVMRIGVWGVVGYCGLMVLANAATPSPGERILWLPVAVLMLVTSVVVARRRDT
jgi:hypothetical protein